MNVSTKDVIEVSIWVAVWTAFLIVMFTFQLATTGQIPTFMGIPP